MDPHGFRQSQLAGIVPNHSEYWEWSHILWFEGACLSLDIEVPVRQQNPVSSLDFNCPLVLVIYDFVLGLSLLKLLPYSLPYCLYLIGSLCGSWHCSCGEVQVHWELQLSSNHYIVWAFLSPRLWATVVNHLLVR